MHRAVFVTGAATANFYYDADGKPPGRASRDQVKTIVNGVTTYYVGNHYEVKNSVVTKYYFAGATRLAVRTGGTLSYLLGDHLGSSSVTTNASGVKTASALYKAFGETRYTLGNLGTDYKFTGQREEASLGIYFFNARWMDPSLGRFTSPDTIVPTGTQGTQAWDRYAFVNNNPVRYNDPTGHYGRDVHYELTYEVVYDISLATAQDYGYSEHRAMAFAYNLASEVGRGDMAADVANPDGSLNFTYRENSPLNPPSFEPNNVAPHWYTTPEAQQTLESADASFDFGVAMHEYQDSFSHWQKLGMPSDAEGIYEGHAANNYLASKGYDEKIDTYNPLEGKYKEYDSAMLNGMTNGSAFIYTSYFAYDQLVGPYGY